MSEGYKSNGVFNQHLGIQCGFQLNKENSPKEESVWSFLQFAFLTIFFVCGFAIIGYIAPLRSPSKTKRSKKKKTAWWSRPDSY